MDEYYRHVFPFCPECDRETATVDRRLFRNLDGREELWLVCCVKCGTELDHYWIEVEEKDREENTDTV